MSSQPTLEYPPPGGAVASSPDPVSAGPVDDGPGEMLVLEPSRWFDARVLDNTVATWMFALLICVAVYVAGTVGKRLVAARLAKLAERYPTRVGRLPDKVLSDIRGWFILALAVYAGSRVLVLPVSAASALRIMLIVTASVQVLITSRLVIDFSITQVMSKTKRPDGLPDPSIASASGIIRFLATLVLGLLLVLLALANLGVEITPLITGLGIGGIAVALAAQSILGDLFGSLTILFDKPFLVGDFIVVGQQMGTVEQIGVKTTRVRALSGEQLVFANSDLLGSRIQNFKRMDLRRVEFRLSVMLETPVEVAERVPGMLREAVTAREKVRLDRSHLKSIGSYALEYEVVYFVLSADYNTFMDTQQAINLDIMRRFAAAGVRFAYPTSVEIFKRGDQGEEAGEGAAGDASRYAAADEPRRNSDDAHGAGAGAGAG